MVFDRYAIYYFAFIFFLSSRFLTLIFTSLTSLIYNFVAKGEPKVPDELRPYPLLVEHYNRVMNIPEIKAWIEKRPKTAF